MNYSSQQVCIDKNIYKKLIRLANVNNLNKPFFNLMKTSILPNLPNEIVFIRHGEKKIKMILVI